MRVPSIGIEANLSIILVLFSLVLTEAMAKRDLKLLEGAIKKTEESGLEQKLGLQLQMAKKILEQLKVDILCSHQEYVAFLHANKILLINCKKKHFWCPKYFYNLWVKAIFLVEYQNYNALLMD